MSVEPLFTPHVDATVVDYLKTATSQTHVVTKVPDPRPSAFTLVLLTGGAGRRNLIMHDAQVTIEAWAGTYAAAAERMRAIDAHMHNARFASSVIRDVQAFSAPAELPAADTPQFRFTATYQVTVRASAL